MPKAQQNRMMFAHRHYEHIAAAIRERMESIDGAGNECFVLDRLARHMADGFAIDNPNFNRERFLKACGVTPSA